MIISKASCFTNFLHFTDQLEPKWNVFRLQKGQGKVNWSRLQIFHRCCTTWSISVFLLCKIDSGWGENSNRQWHNQRWQMLHLLGQAPSHTISTLKDVPGMEQFWNKTMQVVTNWNHNCGAFLKVPLSIFSLIMQLHPLEGDQQKLKHQKSWTVAFNLILAEFTRPSRSRQGNFLYFCTPIPYLKVSHLAWKNLWCC